MTTPALPLCASCARLRAADALEFGGGFVCEAFPDGIPEDIIEGGFDHRKPHGGDGGVLYEMRPGDEALLAAYETSAVR